MELECGYGQKVLPENPPVGSGAGHLLDLQRDSGMRRNCTLGISLPIRAVSKGRGFYLGQVVCCIFCLSVLRSTEYAE